MDRLNLTIWFPQVTFADFVERGRFKALEAREYKGRLASGIYLQLNPPTLLHSSTT